MADRPTDQLKEFYDGLLTLPKLLGDLGLSVAEAQRRLDQYYVESLTEVMKVAAPMIEAGDPAAAGTFETLLKALAPSRYQFSETVVEVRADLQMTTASETKVGGSLGFTAPFAVTINASYAKMSAYDHRAAALIRSTLHAMPANEALLGTLLTAARTSGSTELPDSSRYTPLLEALKDLSSGAVSSPPSSLAHR